MLMMFVRVRVRVCVCVQEGYLPAHVALGVCYLEGVGVARDISEAAAHFTRAAYSEGCAHSPPWPMIRVSLTHELLHTR